MQYDKKVKELLVLVDEYPHIPQSFTIGEVLSEIRDYSLKGYRHVLVFDERFQLVSILSLRELLRDMMPEFFRFDTESQHQGYDMSDESSLAILWQETFFKECGKRMQKPLRDFLTPVKTTIEADAPFLQALYLMLRDNVSMLPVIENSIVIGVIRIADILDNILMFCADGQDST